MKGDQRGACGEAKRRPAAEGKAKLEVDSTIVNYVALRRTAARGVA